jgi:hypothetical protein
MTLHFEELQSAILYPYGQKKVETKLLEVWTQKTLAPECGTLHGTDHQIIRTEGQHKIAFANFLEGLQKNINP